MTQSAYCGVIQWSQSAYCGIIQWLSLHTVELNNEFSLQTVELYNDPVCILWSYTMNEVCRLWNHTMTQSAYCGVKQWIQSAQSLIMANDWCSSVCLNPQRECGCPSGGGIKNGHIRFPSYAGTQKERKKACLKIVFATQFQNNKRQRWQDVYQEDSRCQISPQKW